MSAIWLFILVCHGMGQGFGEVSSLMWMLLLPLFLEDLYTVRTRKMVEEALDRTDKMEWLK